MPPEVLNEELILRSLGSRGYLKFPSAFTEKFEFTAKDLSSPIALLEEKGGKIRLIFEWSEEELTCRPSKN